MVAWLKLDSRSPHGRLTTAVALLPGAMSFLRAASLGVGGGSSNFGGGGGVLRTTSRFYAHAHAVSGVNGDGGQAQARHVGVAFRRRGGGRRGLAMVGGGGGEGSGYDFAKRATRFESSFAEGDSAAAEGAVPVTVLPDKASFERWLGSQPPSAKSWIKTLGQDSHTAGRLVLVPSSVADEGRQEGGEVSLSEVAFCLGEGDDSAGSPFSLCVLREKLPAGTYALRGPDGGVAEPETAALSWAIGGYSFDRFKSKKGDGGEKDKEKEDSKVVLAWPAGADKGRVTAAAASTFLVRDLITTPCEDMGPQHLEAVFASLAEEFGGTTKVVRGDELLKEGDSYPMVHAVGRAAGVGREPRLLDLTWAPPGSDADSLPKVTLVGKGVCFDTGGLDIKPAAGMLTMKKDMGGGAQVLGLARMVMSQGLPVRLRVMVPAVENAIDGGAFRPGDVLVSRSGKTSEIGNTDAEGRLVLADALVEASSELPDLLIDCATLTGAARVALGTEVPVVFCNDEELAAKLHTLSGSVSDQVWRLPLWEGYRSQLSSKIADLKNIGAGGYGGAITAALYLDEFVGEKASSVEEEGGKKEKLPWIHMDFMAFNTNSRPGRPEGGESQGMRALYALLEDKYGSA